MRESFERNIRAGNFELFIIDAWRFAGIIVNLSSSAPNALWTGHFWRRTICQPASLFVSVQVI